MQRLERGLGAVAARTHRRPLVALLVAGLLTAAGVYGARTLTLNADLIELLPESFQSVQDIDKLRVRFGGMGYVVVAGLNAEPEVLSRFAEDMAPKLAALPSIRFVDYKRSADFFEERALYYLERGDLATVRDRVQARIDFERQSRNPLFVNLEDDGEPPSLDFSDIERKYAGSTRSRISGDGVYYLDPDQRMVVLLCKPAGNSADLGFAKSIVGEVQALLDKQDLSKYGEGFETAITGTYKKKVDQQVEIAQDLQRASTLALVLLLAYVIFHFRSLLAVLLTMVPVTAALTWTYGFVGATYGQVNLLTGFLGAILGGLGIEHGIHLLTRYKVLRAEGLDSEGAVRETFSHTGGAALISSLVAALTFLSLAVSEFRAFREFGTIAAIGMIVAVLSYVLVLPPMLGLAARLGWKPQVEHLLESPKSELARWLPRYRRQIALAMGIVIVGLTALAPAVRFDYDFRAIEDVDLPSVRLDRRIDRILGYSQAPVVVLTDDPALEREVSDKLRARKAALGAESTVDFIAGLEDLVPLEQQAKQTILGEINGLLAKIDGQGLDADIKSQLERALRLTSAKPFSREEIPESVRRNFEGPSADDSGFVLVFSRVSLADGAEVRRFAREVRQIDLEGGGRISAAGEAMVLADILDMVTREAPIVMLLAILSVTLAMWLTMGRLREAVFCMLPTMLSVAALTGVMALLDLHFNYLNIVVIPVLIGTTVDAGVHLVSRLSEPGSVFTKVYGETGRAICGGLLTSAVGFGAMLLARHPGLNSIGEVANLGFAVNLIVILLGFPAFLLLADLRRKAATTTTAVNEEAA